MPRGAGDFFALCSVSLRRLHFLYSCKENEAKENTPGLRPGPPAEQSSACTALRQREAKSHDPTRSARRPKTRCLTALKQFGRSF